MYKNKYRAWDNEEKYWLDPEHFYITGEGRPFTCQQGSHAISCKYELMGTDRYILMQFTGLKDKNGKDIYAGDWIKQTFIDESDNTQDCLNTNYLEFEGVVLWQDASIGIDSKGDGEIEVGIFEDAEELEIIGNIHQNPELLTK